MTVQCTALYVRFLLFFNRLQDKGSCGSQARVTHSKHTVRCTPKFYKLSEPTGSGYCQLDKMMTIQKTTKFSDQVSDY